MVSVCRAQPLGVEGVDPEGVYRVQVDDEPAARRDAAHRAHHPGAAEQAERGRCDSHPSHQDAGHDDVPRAAVAGDEHRFVERTIRITPLPAAEADAARASIRAAIPARTGRVI